ncbi:MAG: hypothetical protein ACYDEV_07225 [Acidiferrobacter sp.]
MMQKQFDGRRPSMAVQPKESLCTTVSQQRDMLTKALYGPLRALGDTCAHLWGNRTSMEAALEEAFPSVPYCKFLYALDGSGVQITSNMSRDGLIAEHYGRDRSDRPYMREALFERDILDNGRIQHYQQWPDLSAGVQAVDFHLCAAYISLRALRPSLTAVQFVRNADGAVLGFIGADFALRDLPQTRQLYEEPRLKRRFDPGYPTAEAPIVSPRLASKMDGHLDTVISVVEELVLIHGVYHAMLHFSSSQAVIWVMDDPYRYRLLTMNDLTDPGSCLAYPKRPYPDEALVPFERVRAILNNMRTLRSTSGSFYLRSGAFNVFNGMVSLSFSSDCSHYIPYEDFLRMDYSFWVGE